MTIQNDGDLLMLPSEFVACMIHFKHTTEEIACTCAVLVDTR
jgi:hypothetical protein